MRDRLIELIKQADDKCAYAFCGECGRFGTEYDCAIGLTADYLLENGVIVPPCKVGDLVYRVCKQKYPVDSYRMHWEEDWVIMIRPFDWSMMPEIGETVFLTREEAEQALKGAQHEE